jgi:small subunit ribosomal protein S3
MGQKIHPLGFRLGVTQEHLSNWFTKSRHYSTSLKEDRKVRNYITEYVQRYVRNSVNYGGISQVRIHRNTDVVQIQIHTAFPTLLINSSDHKQVTMSSEGLDKLQQNVASILTPSNIKVNINLKEIIKPYGECIILAEYIALQLESRVAFRKTIKKTIELANKESNINGIRIQISGRLNGAEIARVEWAREGRVPLHTLRAKIDYCYYPAQTTFGVLGIKVWILHHTFITI